VLRFLLPLLLLSGCFEKEKNEVFVPLDGHWTSVDKYIGFDNCEIADEMDEAADTDGIEGYTLALLGNGRFSIVEDGEGMHTFECTLDDRSYECADFVETETIEGFDFDYTYTWSLRGTFEDEATMTAWAFFLMECDQQLPCRQYEDMTRVFTPCLVQGEMGMTADTATP